MQLEHDKENGVKDIFLIIPNCLKYTRIVPMNNANLLFMNIVFYRDSLLALEYYICKNPGLMRTGARCCTNRHISACACRSCSID